MDSDANAYDLFPYENLPLPQTHPGRLAVLGKLAGMSPPSVETCRVLELGASEGANLIPLADAFPQSEFLGIDVAEQPVARGQQTIREYGLRNIKLVATDLLQLDASLGEFDYIIAHGLYAWTPAVVRDKILALMNQLLSPQGIGFVSYNTHPMGHMRRMLRDMMLRHVRDARRPEERLAKAREMLKLLARKRSDEEVSKMDADDAVLAAHAAQLLNERNDSALFHDDLAPIYEPAYFSDFVAHAAAHQLQYLDDAGNPDPRVGDVPRRLNQSVVDQLHAMAGGDRIAELQYQDFVRMRSFRQSLVCHAGVGLESDWNHAQIAGCYASSKASELLPGTFALANKQKLTTTHPVPVEFLRRLIQIWPHSEPLGAGDTLVAAELFKVGAIELHTTATRAAPAGETPCAAPFVRFQASQGHPFVSTLSHQPLQIDEKVRKMFVLADGSRDRQTLATALHCSLEEIDKELGAAADLATLVA